MFDVDERLRELSAKGDALERLFRPELERAVPRADGSKGGRPAFDHVLMFKVRLLQAMHTLSDERCEYLIKDRLSFMRFVGLGLADAMFARFDVQLKAAGYLAMSGQIVEVLDP
jgi:hypothetical protein